MSTREVTDLELAQQCAEQVTGIPAADWTLVVSIPTTFTSSALDLGGAGLSVMVDGAKIVLQSGDRKVLCHVGMGYARMAPTVPAIGPDLGL